MKKTYCDRCGKEIVNYPELQAILPTYEVSYVNLIYRTNSFDLCGSCQVEFNNWMGKWLGEKNEIEITKTYNK